MQAENLETLGIMLFQTFETAEGISLMCLLDYIAWESSLIHFFFRRYLWLLLY